MNEPTAEQRKAIRALIDSTLLPLIGDVLEKKLSQIALFMRDELAVKPIVAATPQRWKCSNKEHGGEFAEYGTGRCPECDAKGLHWSLYGISSSGIAGVEASAGEVFSGNTPTPN